MKKNDFKAVIIEASAGTGKTSRITSEFTGLLDPVRPSDFMRKILAITFSEKAAIEMKTRILEKIYSEIYPSLDPVEKIATENAMLRLNISTIHSFCRGILRRFSFYLNIDPFFKIIDEGQSGLIFYRAFCKVLNSEKAENMAGGVLKEIKLNSLREMLDILRNSHPYSTAGKPEGDITVKAASLFHRVKQEHERLKEEISALDFNDLEMKTYRLVSRHSEALAVLEDFDEMCNFVFIDEFQDTNIVQWEIARNFFEEWLSGYGAKADSGEPYGIYLVGDKKQSIYRFRGAESSIFAIAHKTMEDYVKTEHLKKNYRSAGKVLDFVNEVFNDIEPWREQKLLPGLQLEMPSRVEINIMENGASKESEYEWALSKMFELVDKKHKVWDRQEKQFRSIDFRDMAILMRGRSGKNFALLEKKLKESGIPFVILGGIGFYGEPEIIFLLSLVFCIADPTDKLALWTVTNSVYSVGLNDIYRWRKALESEEISSLFEKTLEEISFWDGINTQQKANTEKFLMLLQDMQHMPVYSIADRMRQLAFGYDEQKADIFSSAQNAVRVLTVHGSKGLEFPAVFLINIEDGSVALKDNLLSLRESSKTAYRYTFKKEATDIYKESALMEKTEEETRVLYVALTRAGQYLFISGQGKKGDSRLWIRMLNGFAESYPASPKYHYDCLKTAERQDEELFHFREDFPVLTSYSQETENRVYSYRKAVLGQIIHKVLKETGEGKLTFSKKSFIQRTDFYFKKSGLKGYSDAEDFFLKVFEKMKSNKEISRVVSFSNPEKAFAEMPFIMNKDGKIYEGFIDRVIVDDGCVSIYDYKTQKASDGSYMNQMDLYACAAKSIFKCENVKRYIIFLTEGEIKQI